MVTILTLLWMEESMVIPYQPRYKRFRLLKSKKEWVCRKLLEAKTIRGQTAFRKMAKPEASLRRELETHKRLFHLIWWTTGQRCRTSTSMKMKKRCLRIHRRWSTTFSIPSKTRSRTSLLTCHMKTQTQHSLRKPWQRTMALPLERPSPSLW